MPDVSLNGIEFEIKGGTEKASASIDDLVAKLDKLSTALESVVNKSGLTGVGNKAKKEIEPLSEALQDLIRNADKVEVLRGKLGGLRDSLEDAFKAGNEKRAWGIQGQILSTEAALEKATASAAPLSEKMQNAIANASQIDILEAKLESLRAAMQRAFDAGDQEGAYKFREQILRTEAALEKTKAALEGVGDSAKKQTKSLGSFISSLKRIAYYRFIRSIIKAITQAFKEGLKNAYEFSKATGDQSGLAASLDKIASSSLQMKNQLGAAFGGLIQAVMPIIQDLISAISTLATWISMLFGMFNGSGGYLKAKDVWEDWGDAAEGAGGAAKKALEYLAPFDELNVLPDPKSGGGGGSATDFGSMFEWTEFEEGSTGKKISDFVKENLEAVEAIAHLFEFAVGLIMVCSNPTSLLGWGLLVYGGYKLWQDGTTNWGAISEQLQGTLGEIVAIASGALLALGIILVASGVATPLGIGLIAAGAIGLAATVTANWNTLMEELRGPIGEVVALISGASLLLGILLCVAGMLPLGLGLIAAGAAGLATTIAANWDDLKEIGKTAIEKVKEGWESVKEKFEMAVQLIKDGWTKVKDWVAEVGQKIGDAVENGVKLVKDGWTKVKDWVKEKGQAVSDFVSSAVQLAKDGWDTVSGWIEEGGWGYALQKSIGVAKDGWETISKWIEGTWMGDKIYKGIGVIRKGWEYISNWISDNFMGKSTPQKGIGIVRKGWDFISNWIKNNWMGQSTPNKGIGIARKGWDFVSNWIKENWMGASTPNKGIGIVRKGWDFVSNWIKEKWMGQSTPQKGIGVMREGWSTIAGWIGGSYMGDALNKGIGLLRDGWTKVSNWIGGNYMGDKLNQSIGLLRSGWTKISEWIKENSFIGSAIDVLVNLKQNGWNTVKQWIENLLGIGSLNLAVTSTISQVGGNSIPSANGVMSSATHPLYSGGFVAIASNGGADGSMTEDLLYRAFSRALADSDLGGDIELDGNTLYKAMVNRNRANTRLTGVNAMA